MLKMEAGYCHNYRDSPEHSSENHRSDSHGRYVTLFISLGGLMPFRIYGGLLLLLSIAANGVAADAPYQHVLLLSIDGLHGADISDPAVTPFIPDILDLANHGVTYSNAYAVKPTDNFPNMIAQVTGAGPKTSGIYYDETYRRSYYPALSPPNGIPGATAAWTAAIDKNQSLINGGGNSDASSIDPNSLPLVKVNGVMQMVYPHNDLKVNTVFEVAHNAGLRTAYIDKHPSYEIVNGPSGTGLDDFYGPESDAKAKQALDGTLIDSSITGTTKGLTQISKSIPLSEAYDDMRVNALINQINGLTSRGAAAPGAPNLFGLSFISVNTAEKDTSIGGIDNFGGGNVVNSGLADALIRTNTSVARVVSALKTAGMYNNTLIVLTAKHGQSPRVGAAVDESTELVVNTLGPAGIPVLKTTDDDVSLVWLGDSSQAAAAKAKLLQDQSQFIDKILIGSDLTASGLSTPANDDRAPDMIVEYKQGYLLGSNKRGEHGGFSEDDSHIALILGGGGISQDLQGSIQDGNVLDTQIAPTMLEALGLDPSLLQGAVIDGTGDLPGSGFAVPEPAAIGLLIPLMGTLLTRRHRA